MLLSLASCVITFVCAVQGFCGVDVKWLHNFDIEDVYGVWYGVGYAQHTPDMTNKPNEVGCVSLYITDDSIELHEDWFDFNIPQKNYTDPNWRSYKSNPWSDTPLSGSWLDVRVKRKAKRNMYDEKRLKVIWDEDGQTMEQAYVYSTEEPGLWTAEKWRPLEKEMLSRGVDVWYPDDPPRHPEVIRVLKVTPHMLIINHCSDIGDGGVFSLILRRSPSKINRWEWHEYKRQFYNFDLPNIYRYSAICGGCVYVNSVLCMLVCFIMFYLLQ